MATCSTCGRENLADARFCSACGARLEPQMPAGERKVVTVLFVDVTGSTRLADTLDVEELREVMSEWFGAVRAEIEGQGGLVEKYIGDAVMAAFGVPTAHEDDPSRALRAALAIRERLVEVNARLEASYGVTMEIRTGINTGEAVAMLTPAPGEGIVTGVAVNVAARLEQLAEPGQTIVSERTVRASPGFSFEEIGSQPIRGKDEPVRAFLLLGEAANVPVRGLPGIHAPLVGRESELELLVMLYGRVVAERRPHLVTIYGDPGIGKSRLVRELLDRLGALPSPPRILVGRCLSYGDGITYWPLAEILRRLGGLTDEDTAETELDRIEALVAGALPELSGEARSLAIAALAFTLGLDAGSAEFGRLQPSALRVELQRAWRMLLSALAVELPLVVVVDDIHWADPVLLDLLEELADRSQGPLLFICPARPELTGARPTWGGGRRNASAAFLSPLTDGAARELVTRLLDVDGLRDDVRTEILARAEGNPFFLEEILRHLIDEGRIVQEDGRWRMGAELRLDELPDTVQGVLAARIDLLRPGEKRTLQHASVVGRIFWRGAVAALTDDRDNLDGELRGLENRELVAARLVSSLAGEEELAFSHILTRDVAYESLSRRERPHAHARVARWIETTTGDRKGEYGALLAHHYWEAFREARRDRTYPADELELLRRNAFEQLVLASHNALRGTAYAAARALASSARETARTADERATALEALGDGARHAALGDDAWVAYSAAVEALREAPGADRLRAGRLSGLALETVVRWAGTMRSLPPEEVALAHLDTALADLGPGESEARVRLMTVQSFWGHGFPDTVSVFRDPSTAERTASEAAEMASRIGRPDLAVVALDAVQHNLQRQLRYEAAFETAQRRLELAQTVGDLGELGDSYAVAAWNASYLGSFAEARDIGHEGYERLLADAPLYAIHGLSWAAFALYYLGEWDALLHDFDLIVAGLGERAGSLTSGFSASWPGVAFVHEARGDPAAADALLEELRPIEAARRRVSGVLTPPIVRLLLLRGDAAAARERLEPVLGDEHAENLPLLLLAEADLLLYERRWAEAASFVERCEETHALTRARYLPAVAGRVGGRLAVEEGRLDDGAASLEAAAAVYDALGMTIDAALARLDAAEALVEGGRAAEAEHLALEAQTTLRRARFVRELGRAEAILGARGG